MLKNAKVLEFIKKSISQKNFEYYSTEYMRLSTMYWAANTLRILNFRQELKEIGKPIMTFLKSCRNKDGGYGMSNGFPSTMLSTLTSLQILYIFGKLSYDEKTEEYILGLFNSEEGSFYGDKFKEEDTRFVCCAILSLKLLSVLWDNSTIEGVNISDPISEEYINHLCSKGFSKAKVIEYILRCYNFDGGFGSSPGAESHAAQIFCCVGALRSLNALESFEGSKAIQFLVFMQNKSGGFCGRPYKNEDVCYSFWNTASLVMLKGEKFIDVEKLKEFIFSCYKEDGGFADKPENDSDIYHTMFSLAGLSLIGHSDLLKLDPGFCL